MINTKSLQWFVFVALFAGVGYMVVQSIVLTIPLAHAQAPLGTANFYYHYPEYACSEYKTQGHPVLAGYGTSYSYFSGIPLIQVACQSNDMLEVNVGDQLSTTWVYTQGYTYGVEGWSPYTLFCPGELSGPWCRGYAVANIPANPDSDVNYIAAYTCEYINGSYMCGCADKSCRKNNWQLQVATIPPPPDPNSDVTYFFNCLRGGESAVDVDCSGVIFTYEQYLDVYKYDLNGDGVIVLSDHPTHSSDLAEYMQCNEKAAPTTGICAKADFNGDGFVGGHDHSDMVAAYRYDFDGNGVIQYIEAW